VSKIKQEALSKGILIEYNNKLNHNHSFIHSKKFFEAYHAQVHKFIFGRA